MVDIVRDGDLGRFADFDNSGMRRAGGVGRAALETLPVIDVSAFTGAGSAAERRRVAKALRRVCIDIGFFYIAGHGIPESELDQVIAWGHRFFALSEAEKMALDSRRTGGKTGYMRIGGIDPEANPDKAADLKERFVMGRDVMPGEPERGRFSAGLSQWPEPHVLPGFESFMRAHIARRVGLAQRLVRAFALSLDLAEDYFDGMYRHLGASLLLNHYPPIDPAEVKETQWSFSPHSDYGMFTVLQQDSVGGLQARNAAGAWIDVPPVDGTLVVNLGDIFAMWTNDLYASTLHRAMNLSGAARISAPLFTYPQGTTVIRCLPTCQGPGNPPRYPPVEAETYNDRMVEQAHRSGRPGLSRRTAERFDTR